MHSTTVCQFKIIQGDKTLQNGMNNYTVEYQDRCLTARSLIIEDITKIYALSKSVTINSENYRRILGIGCEADFRKTGALLETSKDELMEAVLHPESYISFGIWESDDEPVAFLVAQTEDIDNLLSSKEDFSFLKGYEDRWERWQHNKQEHRNLYKGGLAVRADSDFPKLFFVLYYIALSEALDMGYTNVITEVFSITEYYENSAWHKLDIYNERSFNAQVFGGKSEYVADGMIKEKNISESVKLHYYAKILDYDLVKTVSAAKKVIKDYGITIERKRDHDES